MYGWRAGDWVHLEDRVERRGRPKKLRLFVDGREVAFSGSYAPPAPHRADRVRRLSGPSLPGGPGNANGVIDEPHIYTGFDATTGDAARPIAHAGLVSDPSERLADTGRNFQLAFQGMEGIAAGTCTSARTPRSTA